MEMNTTTTRRRRILKKKSWKKTHLVEDNLKPEVGIHVAHECTVCDVHHVIFDFRARLLTSFLHLSNDVVYKVNAITVPVSIVVHLLCNSRVPTTHVENTDVLL